MCVPLVYLLRCDMAFIEPMHRNKPNITYLLIYLFSFLSEAVINLNCNFSTIRHFKRATGVSLDYMYLTAQLTNKAKANNRISVIHI